MPPPTRLELILNLLPPEKHAALAIAANRFGITNEDATELFLVMLFVDLENLLITIPATLDQTVTAIPNQVKDTIDQKIGDVAQTLTGAVTAATQVAKGEIEHLKDKLKTKTTEAITDVLDPKMAVYRKDIDAAAVRVTTAITELQKHITNLHQLTDAQKGQLMAELTEWHKTYLSGLNEQYAASLRALDDILKDIGGDITNRLHEMLTLTRTELTTTKDKAVKEIGQAQTTATAAISASQTKLVNTINKHEATLSRANRFGLAVLSGFGALFLCAGLLAGSWWQMNEYQTTLSQTIQFYEGQLPKGYQMLPAGVVHDAEKLRAYLEQRQSRLDAPRQ